MQKQKSNPPSGKPKATYESQLPRVLEIIKQNGPINRSQILLKLQESAGNKVSGHTLGKCLERLSSFTYIYKTEGKGRGAPDLYFINPEGRNLVVDIEQKRAELVRKMEACNSEDDRLSCEQAVIDELTQYIGYFMEGYLDELRDYSTASNMKTAERKLQGFLNLQLLPGLHEVSKLMKPPLTISKEKYNEFLDKGGCYFFR